MAHRLAAVAMISAALLAATPAHAQEAQEEPPDLPGLYARVLAAVKAEKPNRRMVLDISRWRRVREQPVTRLPEDHVRALLERTAAVHAVCDSDPEGRREQPCSAPGLRNDAFFVSLGSPRMQPNGEVVVSVQIAVPQVEGASEISGITYALIRKDDQWVVYRIADRWII